MHTTLTTHPFTTTGRRRGWRRGRRWRRGRGSRLFIRVGEDFTHNNVVLLAIV